jgi:hypothetical protein
MNNRGWKAIVTEELLSTTSAKDTSIGNVVDTDMALLV